MWTTLWYWWAGRLSALLVPDAAWQNIYAGSVEIHCNMFCSFVWMWSSRCFSEWMLFSQLPLTWLLIASFGFPFCVHPSRCLRCPSGVLICASDEVPCYVHPSRCCVLCILRDVLLCASFEATLVRVLFFWKNVSPLPNESLPGGSLCRKESSLLWNLDRLFAYHRGNARKFCIFGKTSPPFLARCCLRGVLFFLFRVDRVIDAEGSDGKTSPPFLASKFRSFRGYFSFCFVPKVFCFGSF